MEEKIICHQRGKDPLYKTWHASEEHLFMYIHSGTGSIVSGEKIFPIRKGSFVFIAADTYHYTLPDDPNGYDRSKLTVSTQRFAKIADLLQCSTAAHIFDKAIVYAEIGERDLEAVERIFTEFSMRETDDGKEMILLSCIIQLLFFLNKYTLESTAASTGVINRAIKFISENISTDIGIGDICAAINISKHHFCRLFKEHTGMTIMKYILKTRIVLAKNELKQTKLSITEISEKCGFSSSSYFCRVFKEEEHCSPLQYRKTIKVDGIH